MRLYTVTITIIDTCEIEAENEEQAKEYASEIIPDTEYMKHPKQYMSVEPVNA